MFFLKISAPKSTIGALSTTQDARLGPRDETIATGTRWPDSLQSMIQRRQVVALRRGPEKKTPHKQRSLAYNARDVETTLRCRNAHVNMDAVRQPEARIKTNGGSNVERGWRVEARPLSLHCDDRMNSCRRNFRLYSRAEGVEPDRKLIVVEGNVCVHGCWL